MIKEVMTAVTDYLIALQCIYFLWNTAKEARKDGSWPLRFWSLAFGGTALASIAAGTHHAFELLLSPLVNAILWKGTLLAVSTTSFAVLLAVVHAFTHGRAQTVLQILATCKFLGFLALLVSEDRFVFAIMDYGATLLVVLILAVVAWFGHRARAALFFISGIVVSVVAAVVQQAKLGIAPEFDHNAVYHVIQMVGLYFFYRGALLAR